MNSKERLEQLYHFCAENNIRLEFVNGSLIEKAANNCDKRIIYFSTDNLENIQWIILGHEIGHILKDSGNFDYLKYRNDTEYSVNIEVRASMTAYEIFENLGLLDNEQIKNFVGNVSALGIWTYCDNIFTESKFAKEATKINNEIAETPEFESEQIKRARSLSITRIKTRNKDVYPLGV